MSFPLASETTLAVSKPPMLALFTNVGANGTASWNVAKSGYSGNTQLIDVLSCNIVNTNSDGGLISNAANGLPQVYLPASALSASDGICVNDLSTESPASVGGTMASLVPVGLVGFVYLLVGIGL